MSSPRVTAVITSYNYGQFIAQAVESVLAQDFPAADLEVVVVDDGSTDDTPERVKQFGDRIVYIRKPNGGQASALNAGFANARGEIVALLDADDVWLPGKLRRVMEAFDRQPDAVLVQHTRLQWYTETGTVLKDSDPPELSGAFPPLAVDLLSYGPNSTSALAFRKSLLGELLPIPETLGNLADSYLSALAVLKGPMIQINEPLTKYRIHGKNLFSFDQADEKRAVRRLAQLQMLVAELERELAARQQTCPGSGLDSYLMRFRLIENDLRFATHGASRREFFRHLRLHDRVYGPLWSRRYKLFRGAMSVAGLLLGYRRFEALRERYRRAGLQNRRDHWFPAEMGEAAPSPAQKALS